MAKQTYTQIYVAINGTLLSDHVDNVSLKDQADKIELTSFGSGGYKEFAQGFKDATITVDFFQDFAANSVHSILQPIYASGGTCSIKVAPTQGAFSSTNPTATMTARMYMYGGIDGKVGDAAKLSVDFDNAGTAGLVWGTS